MQFNIFHISSSKPNTTFNHYIHDLFEDYYVNVYSHKNSEKLSMNYDVFKYSYYGDFFIDDHETTTNHINLIRDHLNIHLTSILESHKGILSISSLNLL